MPAGTVETMSSPQSGSSEPPGAATALRSGRIGPELNAERSSRLSVATTQSAPSSKPGVLHSGTLSLPAAAMTATPLPFA